METTNIRSKVCTLDICCAIITSELLTLREVFTSVRASDAGPWDTFVTSVGVNQLKEAYTGQ